MIPRSRQARSGERALLVVAELGRGQGLLPSRVHELGELCRTAGIEVADVALQRRAQPDPRYLIGRGKLEDVLVRAMQFDVQVLIFDPDLSPGQAHAISSFTDLKVIDRTILILDIFAQRAKSRDAKLQVELAQLRYRLPRLQEENTMMSRLVGGIGGRGPGETKLEIGRRRARERLHRLEKEVEDTRRQRQGRREARKARGLPVVAIVGYTNAGKSTLLNSLTGSEVTVEDKLFATLDPTTRRLRFPRERELIVADTVGFIRDLPKDSRAGLSRYLGGARRCRLALARRRCRGPGSGAAHCRGRAHLARSASGRDPASTRLQQGRPAIAHRAGDIGGRPPNHRHKRARSPNGLAALGRDGGGSLAGGA